jgi:serine protease Do
LSRAELYGKAKSAFLEVLVDDYLAGSAVLVDSNGLVLTAAHVIGGPGKRIELLSTVAGRQPTEVLAVDLGHDLALLKVAPRRDSYPGLALASASPEAGDDVYLMGTPVFRHAVMTRGMVARDTVAFEWYGNRYVEVMPVDASVMSGMSGGPWLNERCEIVGIQSGLMTSKPASDGIAFMAPHAALRSLLADQRTAATATAGMALEETWQQQADFRKRFPARTEGLVARVLNKDGPATRAGIKQWDVIFEADGHPVRRTEQLVRIMRGKAPGDALPLKLLLPDGAGVREVVVQLGKLEVGWPPTGQGKPKKPPPGS